MDMDGRTFYELDGQQSELLSKLRCWTYYKMEYSTLPG